MAKVKKSITSLIIILGIILISFAAIPFLINLASNVGEGLFIGICSGIIVLILLTVFLLAKAGIIRTI